jgi:hypothetical protein
MWRVVQINPLKVNLDLSIIDFAGPHADQPAAVADNLKSETVAGDFVNRMLTVIMQFD